MFYHGKKEWPALKGRAAEVRAIGKPLLEVWKLHMDGTTQHRQIKLALQASIEMEDILINTRGRNVLPKQKAKEFREAALNYVALMAALRNFFGAAQKLFAYTIKGHYLIHLADHAKYLHPHLGWCYTGEDFMQKVKLMTRSACKAVPMARVVGRVLQKYAVGIYHRLSTAVAWKA